MGIANINGQMETTHIQLTKDVSQADFIYSGIITNNTAIVLATANVAKRNCLCSLMVQNTHATIATEFQVVDGGSIIFRINLPALMLVPVTVNFPALLSGRLNNALTMKCVTTGANVYANAQGLIL